MMECDCPATCHSENYAFVASYAALNIHNLTTIIKQDTVNNMKGKNAEGTKVLNRVDKFMFSEMVTMMNELLGTRREAYGLSVWAGESMLTFLPDITSGLAGLYTIALSDRDYVTDQIEVLLTSDMCGAQELLSNTTDGVIDCSAGMRVFRNRTHTYCSNTSQPTTDQTLCYQELVSALNKINSLNIQDKSPEFSQVSIYSSAFEVMQEKEEAFEETLGAIYGLFLSGNVSLVELDDLMDSLKGAEPDLVNVVSDVRKGLGDRTRQLMEATLQEIPDFYTSLLNILHPASLHTYHTYHNQVSQIGRRLKIWRRPLTTKSTVCSQYPYSIQYYSVIV